MWTLPRSTASGPASESIEFNPHPSKRRTRLVGRRVGSFVWLATFMLAMLGLGLATPADAQPRRGGPAGPPAGPVDRRDGEGPAGRIERRELIKKKIRAMRAYTLTEELALDEQTAGKLFPVLARYDDETDRLLEKRVDIQRRLRHADSLKDPKVIERLLDEAVANQRAFWDLEDKRVADLRKVLTPVQAAKLLVVLPALERKIQSQLRKAIVKRHTAGSADDPDDDQEPDELAPPSRPLLRREAPLGPRNAPSNAPGNTPPCSPNAERCR
jgi:Spy/CpxP family protein refolding chaperone